MYKVTITFLDGRVSVNGGMSRASARSLMIDVLELFNKGEVIGFSVVEV